MRLYIKITLQRIFFIVLLLSIGCEDLLETKDTSPPLITITSPNFNSTVSEIVNIQLMVTDDNDIEYVQVWNNDGILGEANLVSNSIYSYYWDTNSLENGDYTIFAIASDGTNETSSSPLTINVENFVEITINNNTHDQAVYILGSENGIIASGTSKSISLLNDTGNIDFTSGAYQYFKIFFKDVHMNGDNDRVYLYAKASGGSYLTSSANYREVRMQLSGTSESNLHNDSDNVRIFGGGTDTARTNYSTMNGEITLMNFDDADNHSSILHHTHMSFIDSSSNDFFSIGAHMVRVAGVHDGIKFQGGSNINRGKFALYGIK